MTIAKSSFSAPPSQEQVDVYSSLCKIGSISKLSTEAELAAKLGFIGRRLMSGEGKFTKEEIEKEFPDIKNEKNRLLALQSYQDCMFRYVEAFHINNKENKNDKGSTLTFSPNVSMERKREIIFLANELENFKNTMGITIASLPEKTYDKRSSKDKYPKTDVRILDIDNYSRYKAFQTLEGIPNFSNLSNNDIALMCDTYKNEIKSYNKFWRDYRGILDLQTYTISKEASRICKSAKRGR